MFLFSDIHGNYSIWEQIKKEINGTAAICLGDVADRGPDGYKIMKEILSTPNITYLKGNHEELFVRAAREMSETICNEGQFSSAEDLIFYCDMTFYEDVSLHLINGGKQTLIDWYKDGIGMDMRFVNKIARLPISTSLEYEGHPIFDICHAGCSTEIWTEEKDYRNRKSHLLQSRSHFKEEWIPGHILIHGHTYYNKIVKQLTDSEPVGGGLPIYNGNKICLDMRTFKTGKAILLELPSMEYKIIEEKE